MPTTRISDNTKNILKALSLKTGKTMIEILETSVEMYKRKIFFEECNKAYAELKSNRAAWNEELEERRLSDNTLSDGLEEEENA
ncbi:MAG: toxin-antitoxin system protein [Candidatus Eremiobacterota bacterium]